MNRHFPRMQQLLDVFSVSGKFFGPCSSVVEHSLGKGEVARSIRAMGTTEIGVHFLCHRAVGSENKVVCGLSGGPSRKN